MIADKLKDDLLSEGFCLWISKSLVADWATRYYPGDETDILLLRLAVEIFTYEYTSLSKGQKPPNDKSYILFVTLIIIADKI